MSSAAQHAASRNSPAAGPAPPSSVNASAQVVVTRLSYPAGSPRPSSSARRARNSPRYSAMLRPEACMYAPACSSASGSPPSSPASSPAAASSAAPAAPVRSSRNPAATARSSTGTSSTCRPGQDPNWLVITTRPPPAGGTSPATAAGSGTLSKTSSQSSRRASTACTRPTGSPRPAASPRPGARPARRTRPPARPGPRPATATPPPARPPAGARTPPPRWSCPHPPARTAPPPPAPPRPAASRASSSGQQLLPPRQVHRPRRQPHRHPGAARAPRPGLPPRACCSSVSAWNSSISSSARGIHGWTVIPASCTRVPERPLPLPVHRIGQEHLRQRQDRVLIQHEHQPRQAQLPGRGELQLRIGQLRLVPDRRAVPEPDDPRVHIRPPDLLPAVSRRACPPGR